MDNLMDPNVFASVLGIMATMIAGSFGFTYIQVKEINRLRDQIADYKTLHQASHYEQALKLVPMEETFKMMRRVQESRMLETFIDSK